MKLVVVGASGRTGRLVVEQALGHGHSVVALSRSGAVDKSHPRLQGLPADVRDFDAMSVAVGGADAVAFTVSSSGEKPVTVFSEGIANVIHAMATHRVYKLAAISAAGAFARNDPMISLGFRAMIATALRGVYDDMERMEQRIAASDLDWTIVRPVGLSDGPLTGRYRVSLDGSLLPKASRISRADVAACVLKALETDTFVRKTLVIAD